MFSAYLLRGGCEGGDAKVTRAFEASEVYGSYIIFAAAAAVGRWEFVPNVCVEMSGMKAENT